MTEQKPQRVCVFCGSTPLTKEHVFGQWTSDFYSMRKKSNAELSRKLIVQKTESLWGEEEVVFEDRGLNIPVQQVTVKAVCGTCNNGWMGDLELRMKRLYTRLVKEKVPLGAEDVALLERWAIKTAVMWQYNHPESVSVTVEQLAALYQGDSVPGANLRMGRRKFWERDSLFIFGSGINTGVEDDWDLGRERTIVVTLIAIGPLVLVLTLGHYRNDARMVSLTNFPGQQIRPLKHGLTWPGAFLKMTVPQFDTLVYSVGYTGRDPLKVSEPELFEYLRSQRSELRGP